VYGTHFTLYAPKVSFSDQEYKLTSLVMETRQ
jgi:hypothetical protein